MNEQISIYFGHLDILVSWVKHFDQKVKSTVQWPRELTQSSLNLIEKCASEWSFVSGYKPGPQAGPNLDFESDFLVSVFNFKSHKSTSDIESQASLSLFYHPLGTTCVFTAHVSFLWAQEDENISINSFWIRLCLVIRGGWSHSSDVGQEMYHNLKFPKYKNRIEAISHVWCFAS